MTSYLKNTGNSKKRLAEFISDAAYAPLVSIPVFVLINYFLLSLSDFIIITSVCVLFSGILPTLLVLWWLKGKNGNVAKIDMDIPERTRSELSSFTGNHFIPNRGYYPLFTKCTFNNHCFNVLLLFKYIGCVFHKSTLENKPSRYGRGRTNRGFNLCFWPLWSYFWFNNSFSNVEQSLFKETYRISSDNGRIVWISLNCRANILFDLIATT